MNASLFMERKTRIGLRWQKPARVTMPSSGQVAASGQPRALSPLVMASLGVVMVFCWCGVPKAAGAAVFSPIPEYPNFAFTNPVILVTPRVLRFGAVPAGKSATNTFLVENLGHGQLVGAASVSAPFKILSGEAYALKRNEVQVVKVEYTPGSALTNAAVVTFTGGGGAKALVTGRRTDGRN